MPPSSDVYSVEQDTALAVIRRLWGNQASGLGTNQSVEWAQGAIIYLACPLHRRER